MRSKRTDSKHGVPGRDAANAPRDIAYLYPDIPEGWGETEENAADDQESLYPDSALHSVPRQRRTAPRQEAVPDIPRTIRVPDRAASGSGHRTGNGRAVSGPSTSGTARRKHTGQYLLLSVCAVLLCVMGYYVYAMHLGEEKHRQRVESVYTFVFPENTHVNGIDIGGLTREQALSRLYSAQSDGTERVSINVTVQSGGHYLLTEREIPFSANIDAVLDEAMQLPRQGFGASDTSPLEYRWQVLRRVREQGAYYYTAVTYDKEKVLQAVEQIAMLENVAAQDAYITAFDFGTRAFSYSDEVYGRSVDTDTLYSHLIGMLDSGQYSGQLFLQTIETVPAVTRQELMNTSGRISAYTTETTNDANRNTNVRLACEVLNGTCVNPGEIFSFNACTGQRTLNKGYLPAAAIAGGTTVDEVGGGVCQVSSTLFNACAMADLEILERSPHAWPSNYVDKGRDATVNWPNLDYKFRNNLDTPVYIVAYYNNRRCTVEIYGAAKEPGVSITLETVLLSETAPPLEPEYRQNTSLEPGTQQVLKKARTGYEVDTYKVYRQNGTEYRRELLCESSYKMIREVIEYN